MKGEPDLIRFWCQCGRKLKTSPYVRGKIIKCPSCGKSVRVPQASTRKKDEPEPTASRVAEALAEEASSVYALSRPKGAASRFASEPERPIPLSGGKCPKCGTPTEIGAIMCVQCGLNFTTGVVLKLKAKVGGRKSE